MDAIYDRMMDVMNESDSDSEDEDNVDDDYDANIERAEEEIMGLEAPRVNVEPKPLTVEVEEFDREHNILEREKMEKFIKDVVVDESPIFTAPISTTITMEGTLANVRFHEAEFIHELLPSEDVVLIKCNFGKIIFENYREPVKVKKTNRGRKKKEKRHKHRKIQGDGTCFNSQITFVVRSLLDPIPESGIIPSDTRVYKFKVFRTGRIQLPGVRPQLIHDVVACTEKIVHLLNFHLHPGVEDITKLVHMVNINPVMKNYKFMARMAPNELIDLMVLKQLLLEEKQRQQRRRAAQVLGAENANVVDESPAHPNIYDVKYTREETKLSIKFHTPVAKNRKKKARVNIFMRGKFNILGAFDEEVTAQIYKYLEWLFTKQRDRLIVSVPVGTAELSWEENISHSETPEEIARIVYDMWLGLPPLPELTDTEMNTIWSTIDKWYENEMKEISHAITEYFSGTDLATVFA